MYVDCAESHIMKGPSALNDLDKSDAAEFRGGGLFSGLFVKSPTISPGKACLRKKRVRISRRPKIYTHALKQYRTRYWNKNKLKKKNTSYI